MNLLFFKGDHAVVKCRHCGSTNVRISTRSTGSTDHVTYRCKDCTHHFRVHTAQSVSPNLLTAGAFLAVILVSVSAFIYLAARNADDDVIGADYQPTVDVSNPESLDKSWAAARAGNAQAQYDLGRAYWQRSEFREALPWVRAAAAEFRLGLFYRDGLGTPANKESAYHWFNIAAARGHQEALQYREKLSAAMRSEEIHRAQEASIDTINKLENPGAPAP